jgi:hypothetical protein
MSELGSSAPKLSEPGSWIGHYTSAATAFEYIVPTGKLRMSPYRLMRDLPRIRIYFQPRRSSKSRALITSRRGPKPQD